jgi:hypothetical protein
MTVAVRRIWDQKRAMRTGEGIREVHTDDRPRCSWAVRGFAGPNSKERFNACGDLADAVVRGPVDTGVGPINELPLCERHAKEARKAAEGGTALHLVGRLG